MLGPPSCHAESQRYHRICPGRHFALRNLHLVAANILATFGVLPLVDENGYLQPPPLAFKYSLIRSVDLIPVAIQLYCKASVRNGPWFREGFLRSLLVLRVGIKHYLSLHTHPHVFGKRPLRELELLPSLRLWDRFAGQCFDAGTMHYHLASQGTKYKRNPRHT